MRKAIKLQKEAEDRKDAFIIFELENKFKIFLVSIKEKDAIVQSLKKDFAKAQKSNEHTKLERKLKDENIVDQDKYIQELKNEMENMK
jgi:ubiquitin